MTLSDWPDHPHLRTLDAPEQKVSPLELFFDLVYVFAVTQLAHHLLVDLSWTGLGQTVLLLLLVSWWAWIYTTWMANWFDPDVVPVRVVLIATMLLSLLMAVAIPGAFEERAMLFAASYVTLQVLRNAYIAFVMDRDSDFGRAFERILAWSIFSGAIWIIGAFPLLEEWRPAIWLLALAIDYAGPLAGYWTPGLGRSLASSWNIEGGLFSERFQLFIIIALGESIVVTGATASALDLNATIVSALIVAFLGSVALWWLYFDFVADISALRMRSAPDRGQLARDAFTYLHIPIVLGIILTAVGDELVIAHPTDALTAWGTAMVVGGPALYLIGHNVFRWRMARSLSTIRLIATGAVLACGLVAFIAAALVVAAAVVLVLLVLVVVETRSMSRLRATPSFNAFLERLEAGEAR